MTGGTPKDDEEIREIPLSVDLYRFKVTVTSKQDNSGEQAPQNWAEVARQVHHHLMRIVAAPTRFAAQVLESATQFVRGIGKLPEAAVRRVEQAQNEADRRETENQLMHAIFRQGEFESNQPLPISTSREEQAERAIQTIKSILDKYAREGLDSYVEFTENEQIVIVVGAPPESAPEVQKAIEEAQKPHLLESSTDVSKS